MNFYESFFYASTLQVRVVVSKTHVPTHTTTTRTNSHMHMTHPSTEAKPTP